MTVYDAEKTVLNSGNYDLAVEENKIHVFLAANSITTDEHEALINLARNNATIDGELPSTLERLASLEKRVGVIERLNDSTEWRAWEKPTSADGYTKYGEGVSFEGNHYLFVNKDKPARAGFDPTVYPKSWYLVTDMSKTVEQAFADYKESLQVEEKPQTDVPSSVPAEENQNTSTDETTENAESKE